MLRPEEPTAASSIDGSTIRISFAASVATRPYSVAVFEPICQGPSISLPRHQNFTPCGASQPCRRRMSENLVPPGKLQYSTRRARPVGAAGPEIDREHRLQIGLPAPVHELVGAEGVRLDRQPGEVELLRPLLDRPDPVLPVVAGDEVAARIADDRRAQLAHQLQHVAAEALLRRRRMPGLVEPAVDATAEVLDEGPEKPGVGRPDHVGPVQGQLRLVHHVVPLDGVALPQVPADRGPARLPPASAAPGGSAESTEALRRRV